VPERLVQHLADDLELGQRCRTLTPVVTAFLFLKQVLHGNTACSNLRHLAGLEFSAAAYCRARRRLPFGFFHRLQNAVTQECFDADPLQADERWHGHEVYLIDGSSFSMPDTPDLQEAFGQPGRQTPGCGFPVAHMLLSCQLATGYIRKVLAAPLRTHDLSQVPFLHPALPANAVLAGDRALCSFAHLALCRQGGRHGLFRAHQKLIVDFRCRRRYAPPRMSPKAARGLPRSRWLRRLGTNDQLVEYFKPKERPLWLTPEQYAALPETLVVRELRYRIDMPGRRSQVVTLVTTLLDRHRYSRRALARLYGLRWTVETNLAHLKRTLGLDVLHCKTLVGVMKELTMFVTAYNLVRRVMRQAGEQQGVPAERISFIDALRWLAEARPDEPLPHLRVIPQRPGRAEPRVKKRRPKQYDLMNRPRAVIRQALYDQEDEP
jgi:Transposase DDE domain